MAVQRRGGGLDQAGGGSEQREVVTCLRMYVDC